MPLRRQSEPDVEFRSMRALCERYFPQDHARKTCSCYRKPELGVLVIQPRTGRQIRVI